MITWVFVPLGLILPDQPNRVVRTRTLRGVGGGSCEAPPYPDGHFLFLYRIHSRDSESAISFAQGAKS